MNDFKEYVELCCGVVGSFLEFVFNLNIFISFRIKYKLVIERGDLVVNLNLNDSGFKINSLVKVILMLF